MAGPPIPRGSFSFKQLLTCHFRFCCCSGTFLSKHNEGQKILTAGWILQGRHWFNACLSSGQGGLGSRSPFLCQSVSLQWGEPQPVCTMLWERKYGVRALYEFSRSWTAHAPMQVDSSLKIPPKSSILHEESHQARPPAIFLPYDDSNIKIFVERLSLYECLPEYMFCVLQACSA